MFADSDVMLCKDWFEKAEKYIKDDVGVVCGLNIDVIPNVKNKLFPKSLAFITRECFNLRGGMHDTLIRRELVKDIRIHGNCMLMKMRILLIGLRRKAIVGDDVYCLHFRPSEDWN